MRTATNCKLLFIVSVHIQIKYLATDDCCLKLGQMALKGRLKLLSLIIVPNIFCLYNHFEPHQGPHLTISLHTCCNDHSITEIWCLDAHALTPPHTSQSYASRHLPVRPQLFCTAIKGNLGQLWSVRTTLLVSLSCVKMNPASLMSSW